ncbi:MAG: hypothetical protein HUU50_05685, partial [Candidatus Brocadiae bacterium]|nr:hypothetical protein [Candidatus Brocadiia bacterium]
MDFSKFFENPSATEGKVNINIEVGENAGKVAGIEFGPVAQLILQQPSGKVCQGSGKVDIAEVPFEKLRVGSEEEFVGRKDALAWLKTYLLDRPVNSVAVVSVHGAGGMGKTFLAHVFASQYREKAAFLEVHLGERTAFDAGLELLDRMGWKTDHIDSPKRLQEALLDVYAGQGGILILDDVCKEDAQILLPASLKWRAMITTRSKSLAQKLTKQVFALDSLQEGEAIELFRKVLGSDYDPKEEKDYCELAESLARRPYGIRLAAESLKTSLTLTSPARLLEYLKTQGLVEYHGYDEDQQTLPSLRPLLEHCLRQLEAKSARSRQLLNFLAACSDDGMEIAHFLDWQSEAQTEHELIAAQDLGLLLVEKIRSSLEKRDGGRIRIRMHTDLLTLIREGELAEERKSLQTYLHRTLVLSPQDMERKRELQKQIVELYTCYKNDRDKIESLYWDLWGHLYRTSSLTWAYELGEALRLLCEEDDLATLQGIYGNQALILKAWGKLDEAMTLLKKEEQICEQLGDRAGLSSCYGNQALILHAWGKLDE